MKKCTTILARTTGRASAKHAATSALCAVTNPIVTATTIRVDGIERKTSKHLKDNYAPYIISTFPLHSMPALTKDDLLKVIKKESACVETESQMRFEIERTKDYQAVSKDIEDTEATMRELLAECAVMRERQKEMLSVVKDSRPALEQAKAMLLEIMRIEGVEGYNEDWISVSGKFSETRKVDGKRLLEVLGGDIDEFVSLVKPTQKAIKEYATEHEALKKPLLQCIRLEGRELVGLDIQLPEAQ